MDIETLRGYIQSGKRHIDARNFDSFFQNIPVADRCAVAEFLYFNAGQDIFSFMKKIPDGLFKGSSLLTSVDIPSNVVELGSECFTGCSKLTEVTMADSVRTMGSGCFKDCDNLSTVTLSKSLKAVPSASFQNDKALTYIMLPDSVMSVGLGAFSGCDAIQIRANKRSDYDSNFSIKQPDVQFFKQHFKFKKVTA